MNTPFAQRGRDLIRRGPFARLWWSQAISSLGDWVNLFANFALATRLAGGGRGATIAILVPLVGRILPGLVFGFLGGLIADRWSRKTTMIVSDFGRAVLVLGLLFVRTYVEFFVLVVVIEIFALIRQPAREAVVPTLVKRDHLLAVNGLNLAAMYGTAPVGSLLFALLAEGSRSLPEIGTVGSAIGAAFLFDSITFIASGLLVVFIPIQAPKAAVERAQDRQQAPTVWRDVVDGMKFVFEPGPVRRLMLGMSAGLFGGGALFVLGQPFSEQVLRSGESGYGILITALGVGVGLGMLGVTVLADINTRREPLFGFSLLVAGVAIGLAAFADGVLGAAGWAFVAGMGTGIAYVSGFTHLHASVADEVRGRTFAAVYTFSRTALLISFALAGVGAAALAGVFPGELNNGIRAVMLLGGVVVGLSGAAVLVGANLWQGKLDDEKLQRMSEAADTITWMRGARRREED
ncbi:MAG TPA: MFS transporter [Acidimicrobiia bacterium]|jgi:dTMP kinase|nr:MFS transporter [Acidimicrobiia bacterium]